MSLFYLGLPWVLMRDIPERLCPNTWLFAILSVAYVSQPNLGPKVTSSAFLPDRFTELSLSISLVLPVLYKEIRLAAVDKRFPLGSCTENGILSNPGFGWPSSIQSRCQCDHRLCLT